MKADSPHRYPGHLRRLKAFSKRLWSSQWLLALVLCLIGGLWLLVGGNPLEIYEFRFLDSMLRWRAEVGLVHPPDSHIVHLDLDADYLDKLPDLPQEYQDAADIVTQASELGASVIVFDIVFGRGSRESAQPILDAIEDAKSRNCSVVLAEFLHGPLELKRSFPFNERLRPSGLANVQADSDGVLRRYAFVRPGPEGLEPSLALAGYLCWREIEWDKVTRSAESASWMELNASNSALEPRQVDVVPILLNFRNAWDASGTASFRHYTRGQLRSLHSARQASDNEPSPLINSILIVSVVSSGAGDVVTTPFGSNQPGAIVHSTAINDLVQGTSIIRLPRPVEAAALCIILPFAWATRFCRRTISLFVAWILVTAAIIASAVTLLLTTNYLLESITLVSLWTLIIVAELARRYAVVQATKSGTRDVEIVSTPREHVAVSPAVSRALTGGPVRLVYSYSHHDEALRRELETHLALLERQGVIASWSDRKILAGEDWAGRIDEHFKRADIILLLISADFLSSNYCYEIEMENALERHRAGTARVVPIILRDADWHSAPFGELQAIPRGGKPITLWANRDEAWAVVARGIRNVIDELHDSRARA